MSNSHQPYRIIVTGGGTGGHVFPALAVAQELKEGLSNVAILFVGAEGKMEMRKVPEAGFSIIGLKIAGFQRKLSLKNFLLPFKLLQSLRAAQKIIKKFKPNVVVGFGGYASGPTLIVAHWMKIPTLIQEQNSYAGLTNKWLGKRAKSICVAYEGMERFFPKEKIVVTGNPVRKQFYHKQPDTHTARQFFGLDISKRTVLIIGGSLGARTLNEAMVAGHTRLTKNGVQVIWQCGGIYHDEMVSRVSSEEGLVIKDFIKEMEFAYAAADLVVSRAGALSIAEITVLGKASILVPSPNVAEDHQTKNAQALVSKNAAVLVEDYLAKDQLIDEILQLIHNEKKCQILSERSGEMAFRQSEKKITEEILGIIK